MGNKIKSFIFFVFLIFISVPVSAQHMEVLDIAYDPDNKIFEVVYNVSEKSKIEIKVSYKKGKNWINRYAAKNVEAGNDFVHFCCYGSYKDGVYVYIRVNIFADDSSITYYDKFLMPQEY